jgi:CubicO group peptidase (beta-lactamase class C family)
VEKPLSPARLASAKRQVRLKFSTLVPHPVWLALLLAPGPPPASAQETLDSAAVSRRADAWLSPFESAGDFSGVVLIAQGDKVLFEKAYGFADPQVRSPNRTETRFRVASVSKTFTAAAIERLAAEGKLHYSDHLSRYIAGVPNGDSITIEQLLEDESGVGVLDTEDVLRDCLSHDDLLRRIAAAKPLFAPGKGSQYSNEGYFLLAAVIERITGISYQEFLRTTIFAPLKMDNSGTACRDLPEGRNAYGNVAIANEARFRPLPFNEAASDGAGSVFSNAEDLYRWLRAVDTDPRFSVAQLKYPFGWGKRKYTTRDLIEQSGQLEGFNSHVAIYPKDHIYAVILSNIQSGFSGRIPRDLEAVLFGNAEISKPPVVSGITVSERSMLQYVGGYHSREIPYPQTLAVRDGQLAMHWGQDPFWREMVMTNGDTFFLRAEYAEIHFDRGSDGFVHGMTWNWPGGAHLSFDKDKITGNPEPSVPPDR